jgi:hypothetical protein
MNEMLEDSEYQLIAKKIICNACTPQMAERIYNDPIKFGTVVNAVMMADWEYNGKGSIFGYRKQRAKWAIYKIISEMGSSHTHTFSELSTNELHPIEGYLAYDIPDNGVERNDYENFLRQRIESSILTENEKKVLVGKILENKTVNEMSSEFGIRGEAVRQTLKRGIRKIGKSLCDL